MPIPTVSVVMPVFNGGAYLREALESILSQTYTDFEFIVINDGSTDGTASILDSYTQRDSRVCVYHQENRGLVDSLNRGCGLAKGKYLAIMHADDISVEDRLQRQIEFMENHTEIGAVGGTAEFIDGAGRTLGLWRHPVGNEGIKRVLFEYNPLIHSAVVTRREAFLAVGGYRKLFPAEDYDLWLRIAERWQLANLDAVVLRYRVHPKQATCHKRRQEALCTIAARALASLRRDGKPEPAISGEGVTPKDLAQMGVDDATQRRALIADYSFWIEIMSRALPGDTALQFVDELISLSTTYPVDRIALSKARLSAARVHYQKGRPVRAMIWWGRAVTTHPIVIRKLFWEPFIYWTFPLRKRLGLRRRKRAYTDGRPV